MDRRQQIINLENEIVEKQKNLSELKTAEERQDPEDEDLTQDEIEDIVNNILL